ncbi:hypothetical protein [Halorussus caseinilyticus]|uniref:hypothetical protein n=1 Tax=Halorussus caseinilyticus TaxID=3034025 RepID=UPI0023E8E627|nr:hypothetical protein [Halorussus sp. DT72]
MFLDVIDTNVWVQAINWQTDWAEKLYDEVVADQRFVYLSRYIVSEIYEVSLRERGKEGAEDAQLHLSTLWNLDSTVMPHPQEVITPPDTTDLYGGPVNRRRTSPLQITHLRHNPFSLLLEGVFDSLERGDAPILADAYKMALLSEQGIGTHRKQIANPVLVRRPEEMRFFNRLRDNGVSNLTSRIITNDGAFSDVNPSSVGIDNVVVEEYPKL